MKAVILIFPDTTTIAEYVLAHKISKADINSREQSLTAVLTDEEIAVACTQFKAILQSIRFATDSNSNFGLSNWRRLQ
jgi:hypothetical protein